MRLPSSETVLTEVRSHVAVITLNRPKAKNALDSQMVTDLCAVLAAIRADDSLRCVVLTGSDNAFCSGGDVKSMASPEDRTPERSRKRMLALNGLARDLIQFELPVIAAVDGPAVGAGFGLALTADLIVVSERSTFCLAFQKIGLIPDMGVTYTLPRIVGLQCAKELFFSARELKAVDALKLGLAYEVVDHAFMLDRAFELAAAFATASPAALAMGKRALNASFESSLDAMLTLEANSQAVISNSDYLKESSRRFAAKEKGLFSWPHREKV